MSDYNIKFILAKKILFMVIMEMNSCKKFLIGLIIFVIVNQSMYFLSPIMGRDSTQGFTKIVENPLQINYVDHNPIIIISDNNFTDYGFTGNGTADNPYLIENLEISSLDHYFIDNGISIEDTTKHFVIQNCLISANSRAIVITNITANSAQIISNSFTECRYGVDFSFAEGIILRDNNLTNCDLYGIYGEFINKNATIIKNKSLNSEGSSIRVRHCNNVTIDSNECTFGGGSGISLSNSSGYIINNNCSNNDYRGISIGSTDFDQPIYVWNNTCEHNDDEGIFAWDVTEVINNTLNYNHMGLDVFYHAQIVLNNTLRGNGYGAEFNSVGVFSKNKCLRNSQIGLNFEDTHRFADSNITDNIFFANRIGIRLETFVEYANISYNLFQENRNYGIELLDHVENITIHHNTFFDNNPDGSSQGYDEQTENIWFDLDAEEGNYWSDWIGEGWYLIDGGDNADIYPLAEPLHERFIDPEPIEETTTSYSNLFAFEAVFIVAVIGIAMIVQLKKKQKI